MLNKYKIEQINNSEQIENLKNQSALTFEGMNVDQDNLNDITDWLNENNALIPNETPVFHVISGKLMNTTYQLTNKNKYPNDLTILSITNINQAKIAVPRFEVGGRWLDDIIDNNLRRENDC